jgi:hypothetical protein
LKEEIDISSAAGYLGFLSVEDVSFIITSAATTLQLYSTFLLSVSLERRDVDIYCC